MKKDVTINIRGTYNFEGDEADVVELFTTGELSRRNGSYYISYDESEVTGFNGSRTTLKVEDQRCVTMSRKTAGGRGITQLIVQNGVRHQCQYDTGFGDMMVGVSGRSINSTLSDRGGKLEFKYSLDINSLFASDNEMLIIVRED